MLHLAQVVSSERSPQSHLKLLACQQSETTWAISPRPKILYCAETLSFQEGSLVLVDLSDTEQILSIQDATDWILKFIKDYLGAGMTPDFLRQEAERAEQWRHSLTLQSQDLSRRALELEARREQIEALEAHLKSKEKRLAELETQLTQAVLPDPPPSLE